VPRKGEHHGSGSAHASSVRDHPRGSRNERTRHRACPTTATPTEWLLEGKEVTEIDGRSRAENPAEFAGRANARRPETVSGQRFSSAERQICRLWIGSGRGLGGRAHPGPSDAVSHRDRAPRLMPGRCGVCGSLLVAKGRQEIAGGFQVGLFDFGDWIGLHRENWVIRTNEKLPRDTMSRGEVLRLSFRRGRRSREVPSNCRTGRGESVRSSTRAIRPPVVSWEPASRLRSREMLGNKLSGDRQPCGDAHPYYRHFGRGLQREVNRNTFFVGGPRLAEFVAPGDNLQRRRAGSVRSLSS
jgi:hypothetical protein